MYCPSVLDQGQNSPLLPDVKAQCMKKKSYYLYVSIFLHVPIFSPFQLGQKMEKKKQSLEKCSDLNCDEDCQS